MSGENTKPELSEDEKNLFYGMSEEEIDALTGFDPQRRQFLKQTAFAGSALLAYQLFGGEELFARSMEAAPVEMPEPVSMENAINVAFKVNGSPKSLAVDSRMTLLDTLRERLDLTGTKKGCDHGQCGACTVIVDGKRILSCLTLAASCQNKSVTSIEGLAKGDVLHPMQAAFIKHDGFQCGYCTPGQICSAVALVNEAKNGELSFASENFRKNAAPIQLSDDEIRERMSGNICRCGAYPNIVDAIREVQHGKAVAQTWQFSQDNSTPTFITSE